MNQAQLAMDAQFLHRNTDQVAAGNFVFNADFGQEGDAISQRHKAFNGLQGGQFDSHVQGSFVFFEGLNDLVAIRRGDDMRDERFGSQLPDANAAFARQRMLRWNDENQLIGIDDDRGQFRVLGLVGEDAKFALVAADIVGKLTSSPTSPRTRNWPPLSTIPMS